MSEEAARLTWRPPWAYRIFFGGVGLLFLVLAVLPWEDTTSFSDGLAARIVEFTLGLVLVACGWRPVVKLLDDRVLARGVVFNRTVRLEDLKRVEPGYYGLTLVECDGKRFTVSFVGERANYAAWLGKKTRADSKAQTLVAAANDWRDSRDE